MDLRRLVHSPLRILAWALGALAVPVVGLLVATLWQSHGSIARAVWIGAPLLELRHPLEGARVPFGGLAVVVEFPDRDRVIPGTLRCLLNGADLTGGLTRGDNGAAGSLYPLREGRNLLRIEVFGKGRFGDRVVEDFVEVEFETGPLPSFDLALPHPRAPQLDTPEASA
jgi:hypothetical protein